MRFIIYGAGGIGGVVGGHLARTGHDVIMVGRQGHVDAINQHGLRLVTPGITYNVKLTAVAGLDKIKFTPDDVVFTTMKGQSTEEAAQSLKAHVNDVPIFCFQNGMRNEGTITRFFPRVYGVMVRIGAEYLNDGEVTARRDPPGWLVIGRYPNGTDGTAETVAASLRTAGFLVKVSPDVMPYKWGKLMLNLANAVDAITNAQGAVTQPVVQAAQNEAKDILKQAALHWVSADELAKEWPDVAVKPRGVITGSEHSSTWQSLTRKTGNVETEFLNGEIVNLARRIGKKAPINETLLRISQEMAEKSEFPGTYTPAQLRSLLGLS